MNTRPGNSRQTVALAVVVGLGAALRLSLVLSRHALSEDDAMLAVNVAARTYAELLEPLHYGQVAPVLHLWLLRLAGELGGMNDLALRFVPLLAGVILPFATWRLARHLLDPWHAVLVATFVALAPLLIRWSHHIKPYQMDALVTVVLAGFALKVLARPDDTAAWWRLAWAGLVALLASLAAPFVLAGASVALAWHAYSQNPRSRASLIRAGAVAFAWGVAFAALYTTLYRDMATGTYMQTFWDASFLTPRALVTGGAAWDYLARLPLESFGRTRVVFLLYVVAWGLVALGAVHIARRRGAAAALVLTVPIAAALVASALRRYPVSQRLLLYAAPLFMVLIAAGLSAVRSRLRTPVAHVMGAVAAVLVVALAMMAANRVSRPFRYEGMRQLVAELRSRGEPDVPVYVYSGAIAAWTFYHTDWRAPDREWLALIERAVAPEGPAFPNAPPRGRRVGAHEGEALVFCSNGPAVLLGLSTGIHAQDHTGFLTLQSDTGWAHREAERIAAAARPDIWLVFAYAYRNSAAHLLGELRARGAQQVEAHEWRAAKLYRYRMPRSAMAPAGATCDSRYVVIRDSLLVGSSGKSK